MAGGLFKDLLAPLIRPILEPIIRPFTRLIVGFIAVPISRLFRKKVVRIEKWDQELEKDIDQWFRASLVLLFASKNVEESLALWLNFKFSLDIHNWFVTAGRLLLAIGVIESMPDQHLFSLIHPGPPRLKYVKGRGVWGNVQEQWRPYIRGMLCRYLSRTSPVFAIMSAIFGGIVGWTCYGLAITQYLIIGLITSRDRALDVLSEFDLQTALQREELMEEFGIVPGENEPATLEQDLPTSDGAPAKSESSSV